MRIDFVARLDLLRVDDRDRLRRLLCDLRRARGGHDDRVVHARDTELHVERRRSRLTERDYFRLTTESGALDLDDEDAGRKIVDAKIT
jgi:hypothetical protein